MNKLNAVYKWEAGTVEVRAESGWSSTMWKAVNQLGAQCTHHHYTKEPAQKCAKQLNRGKVFA